MPKFTPLTDELYEYLSAHRTPDDAVLEELRQETRSSFGRRSGMQVAGDEGALLGMLVRLSGAQRAVEVGVFTGYSALCIARALPPGGTLLACDVSQEYTDVARRYWEKAGVADKIDLRLGPAEETLWALPGEEQFDFGFVDADKSSYRTYYEEILGRLRPGGLLCIDNVLWGGRVIDPRVDDPDTNAIRAVNDHVAADPRVDAVMLAVSDGVTLVRKR